jgi:cytidine deaminase
MVSDEQRKALIQAACGVRRHAYSPYSNYAVGAAILAEDGRIYTGVNVENASYGLTSCAERAAVFTAVSEGVRRFEAIAVCTENQGAPCGACRQVMSEFAGDIPLYISDVKGNARDTSLNALLPDNFGPEHLLPG